jgi:hemoglobin-like flavoprotein
VTPRQIALVQATWREVHPVAERAAEFFYGRLFALDPSLRLMFRADLQEQGRKLMATIAVAVDSLAHLEDLASDVRALGRRHAGYGVEERHYATVGAALIWTLERVLGAGFTGEMADAWSTAYGVLADVMKEGIKDALPARAL